MNHEIAMETIRESPLDRDLQSDSPTISWPLNRPSARGPWTPKVEREVRAGNPIFPPPGQNVLYAELLPGQSRALDGISLRAFLLGMSLATNGLISVYLLSCNFQVWRAPFHLSALSLFHFLEFFITAAYNTRYANISAYLLSHNGKAYNIAHSFALLECITASFLFPHWQATLSSNRSVALGLALTVVGQVTRSVAMAHAGTNFNHTVQMRKLEGHELVTTGIYAHLRHPSYFGFFWWGIGTQLVMGNLVCLCVYTVLLWCFFKSRITKEEELLIGFFGEDYEKYRRKTRVAIPFIS